MASPPHQLSGSSTPLARAGADGSGSPTRIDRRRFLGFMVKGAGLAVGLQVAWDGLAPSEAGALVGVGEIIPAPEFADELDLTDLLLLSGDPYYYDYLIRITADNRVRFELPRMEQGQGIDLAATMIVAEELDVRLDQIDVSLSPAEIRRSTGQITGGSHSVTSLWDPLRKVTAMLREVIVAAAAVEFGITPDQVTTRDGQAIAPDGRTIDYADLSEGVEGRNDAARVVEPKDPATYRVVGTPQTRLDARDIVTGAAQYAMDLDVVPDAMPCVVARPPTLGGTVNAYDDSAARDLPGVIEIVQVPTDVEGASSGVAVIARSFGEAFRARDALDITWNPGPADDLSDADIIEELRAINLPTLPPLPALGETIGGEFIFPYFAHAPMETMTAIADVSGGKARVWTGAKTPIAAQAKIARDLGILPTDVEVNVIRSGGSFGRRLFFDAAVEAARISSIANRPVKLMFTRQEDTKFGRARPLSLHNVQVNYLPSTLLTDAEIVSFDHRCATPELDLRHGFGEALTALGGEFYPFGYSQTIWHTTQLVQYNVGATTLALNETPFPVPTSSWRGIYSGTAAVANEVIIDELARELGEDEFQFRMNRLDDDRSKGVLAKIGAEGPWGRSVPVKRSRWWAQGLGLHKEYKSRAAVLAEVEVFRTNKQGRNKEMRVRRVVVALDVNRVVNPRGLEAQAIGAVNDAIAYVIRTGLHLDNGAIRESSYGDFEIPRMKHSPTEIEVHFMPTNGERPGGAGELVVPAAAAAIANAFARATGIKPRQFPLVDFYPEA